MRRKQIDAQQRICAHICKVCTAVRFVYLETDCRYIYFLAMAGLLVGLGARPPPHRGVQTMRTKITAVIIALAMLLILASCDSHVVYGSSVRTIIFTDSAGRQVEVPETITRVAPSGSVATMILATLCPELMVCVSGSPSSSQYKYLPANLIDLPTTGQLYGSRSTINLESLIEAAPQVILDLGDRKENIGADMDALQRTTGVAAIFLEADLINISEAYRVMGDLLGLEERAETIASFIDETMFMAAENAAKIAEAERKTVMYTTGSSGLASNADGSVQAQVIEIVGAKNAIVVEDVSNSGGGNIIGLEQLYNFDPDVILFAGGSIYSTVAQMPAWSDLSAVRNDMYYEIPALPYSWMANPPSINMILGVWWLGNLLYPEVYDFDAAETARHIYRLFWGYELSDEEAYAMLAASTYKKEAGSGA